MSALLPAQPEIDVEDRDPELVGLNDDKAATVFEALTSRTARRVLARLYEEPSTASDVADAVDTSLQNATYHLSRLCEADLVTTVGTWYSSRGVEMTVYAPVNEPLLLVAGAAHTDSLENDLASLDQHDCSTVASSSNAEGIETPFEAADTPP